jgi:hypothetical protein
MCHERGKEKMSHPDPRHPAEANGAYPYGQPVHDSAITGTGTGMPDTDTRQYEEWHHADPPPRGAGGWDAMQEFGPPPDWADGGVFIAVTTTASQSGIPAPRHQLRLTEHLVTSQPVGFRHG